MMDSLGWTIGDNIAEMVALSLNSRPTKTIFLSGNVQRSADEPHHEPGLLRPDGALHEQHLCGRDWSS